jgi:hypothetical protein
MKISRLREKRNDKNLVHEIGLYQGEHVKEIEIGWTCDMHKGDEKYDYILYCSLHRECWENLKGSIIWED